MQKTKNLSTDASRKVITYLNTFTTTDATSTPYTSPLAVSNVVLTIVPPTNAVEFVVRPSVDMRISDDPTMTTYTIAAANTQATFPCADMAAIYVVRDSSDLTLNFRFLSL